MTELEKALAESLIAIRHRKAMLEHAEKKRCSTCMGTGKVITLEEGEIECPCCEDGYLEECDHQYAERTTAPLGVTCIHCGKFVGAWE